MIATQNTTWGFFGTVVTNGRSEPEAAVLFDATARALMKRFSFTAEEARDFLDAKSGRHLADQLRAGETGEGLLARLSASPRWKRWLSRASAETKADAASPIALTVKRDEASLLRYALDHALSSISQAHPKERAHLQALLEKLDAAERRVIR